MKFIIVSPKNRTVYNFRGDLIKAIQDKGYEVIVTGPNQHDIDKILDLGVKFVEIGLKKTGINVFEDIRYSYKLFKLFKEERPDGILCYTIKPVIYGSIAAKFAKVRNISSMITGVGYVFTAQTLKAKIIRFIVTLLYKIGLFCADNVIFQNEDDMQEFVDRKLVREDKCYLVNGSGVNMLLFKPEEYPDDTTFFMLSRVLKSKGIVEYLEASKIVKTKYPGSKFMLLGAIENMQDSLSKKDIQPYIDEGIIDYYGETKNVKQYYSKSSVYVLPSYREGTPRTVLEAMAMGRPIITTDTPGCRGTVINGKNGLLVPVKDCVELSKAMEWFVINSNQIKEMGQESIKLCKEKYDVNKVNEDMLKHMKL